MKKILAVLAVLTLSACASSSSAETVSSLKTSTVEETEVTTDTVSGASSTRTTLSGDDYDEAIDDLISISNDLATQSETEEAGYEAPEEHYAQVMSVNDDGSVAMSTIHAWKVEKTDDGATITVVMTDGRTISNLIATGAKGTILIHGNAYYLLHVENIDTTTLAYSDEDYEAGKFNSAYSGADEEKNEYTVTFDIYDLESTYVYMFD